MPSDSARKFVTMRWRSTAERHGLHVLDGDVRTAAEHGARLCPEDEIVRAADRCAPRDVILHELRRAFFAGAAAGGELHGVTDDRLRDRRLADDLLVAHERLAIEALGHVLHAGAGRGVDYLEFLVLRQVVDDQAEHEPILLDLRERIGALLLDRVLRREHEERLLERVGIAAHRDLVLLHRLEQRGLRLGRRAVDFVREQDVA